MPLPSEMSDDARYLREMIERTASGMDRLERKFDEGWARVDRILRGGNGKPGLEEQVRRNTEKLDKLASAPRESTARTVAIVSLIMVVLGGVIELAKYIFGGS